MGHLSDDQFVRALAQFMVLLALSALALVGILTAIMMTMKVLGLTDHSRPHVFLFVRFLSTPLPNLGLQFGFVFGSIVPVVLASVCFQKSATSEPLPYLNMIGRFALVIMLIGLFASFISLMLISVFSESVYELFGSDQASAGVQATIAAVMSCQAIYFAQLTSLRPK